VVILVEFKKILVVDDESKIVEVVTSYLQNSGYRVYPAFNGRQALEIYEKVRPCLVILDLMLPDMMGEEVCQRLRRISRVPIIMLTAKVDEDDFLNGLHLGADDYVTKPFSPKQLVARVEALLRRTLNEAGPLANLLSYNNEDLVIDGIKHEVRKKGNIVNLTPNEYKILISMVKFP
jgi:DNA-binding response OmpR family regulator